MHDDLKFRAVCAGVARPRPEQVDSASVEVEPAESVQTGGG
jgi:hypothetical protein